MNCQKAITLNETFTFIWSQKFHFLFEADLEFYFLFPEKFISSQPKLNIESKKFLYKSFKAHQHKEGYKIKSQKYAVIWSQMFHFLFEAALKFYILFLEKFISSQPKLNIETKKLFYKSFKGHQSKEGYGGKSQNYAVIWSQMFIS